MVRTDWWPERRITDQVREVLRKHGAARDKQHEGKESTRNLAEVSTHYMGLVGEYVFCLAFWLLMDLTLRYYGDGGVDVEFPQEIGGFITINVKATAFDGPDVMTYLLVEMQNPKTKARIRPFVLYVLTRYRKKQEDAELVGWAWGWELIERGRFGDPCGSGIMNHYMAAPQLHKMSELYAMRNAGATWYADPFG